MTEYTRRQGLNCSESQSQAIITPAHLWTFFSVYNAPSLTVCAAIDLFLTAVDLALPEYALHREAVLRTEERHRLLGSRRHHVK